MDASWIAPEGQSLEAAFPSTGAEATPLPALDDPLAVVNLLHEVLASAGVHADIGLPQVAVVGAQSVGKSSVLQGLVGKDFLPSGSGIVTRRPLVLQLRRTRPGTRPPTLKEPASNPASPSEADADTDWAEFSHKPKVVWTNFEEVRNEIVVETNRLCGDGSVVSADPIILSIFSPRAIDLTLVDLPGLTRVPTGDQSEDIPQRIRELVLRYVSSPSCLILAVSAANADLTTSDALALAREVDPKGERTLGVLTKLDLAKDNTNALDALLGRIYPLQLGYVGVVCRSEADSKAGLSFQDKLKVEADFVEKNPLFRHVAEQCGIPHLAVRLHELLLEHIRVVLPDLSASVRQEVEKHRQDLASYGDLELEQRLEQGPLLLHLISGYVRNFESALEGRPAGHNLDAGTDVLLGGARIHHIFHRIFAREVLNFDAFNGLSDLEIRAAMRNAAGTKPQLFVSEVAFEALVKRQIKKLEDPSLQCVGLVHEELKRLASQNDVPEMSRYPAFRERILEVAQGVIKRCLQPTNRFVLNLVKMELAHINVNHPDFIGGPKAMSQLQVEPHVTEAQPLRTVEEQGFTGAAAVPEAALRQSSPAVTETRYAGNMSASMMQPHTSSRGRRAGGGGSIQLPDVPRVVKPLGEPSDKERMDTELLKSLISSYYAVVKRKIIDLVPKAIMNFMVSDVRGKLHQECISELYRPESFATLLKEADDTQQRLRQCKARLTELEKAQEILAMIRETSLT